MASNFQGYQLIIWQWVVMAVSVILLGIRIYIDKLGLRRVAVFRDVLLAFALLIQLACCIIQSIMNDWDYYNIGAYQVTSPRAVDLMKMDWSGVMISFTMGFIFKSDLLWLYHDLAPKEHHPKFFWMIICGWVFVAGNWILSLFWGFLSCRPLYLVWTPGSSCQNSNSFLYLVWITHLMSEIVLYIIPLVIISRVKNWDFRQKLAAASMFFVGTVNILCIVGAIAVQLYQINMSYGFSFTTWVQMYTYGLFQSGVQWLTAILVLCMPQLKQFYILIREKLSGEGWKTGTDAWGNNDSDRPHESQTFRFKKPKVGREVPVNINVSTLGVLTRIRSVGSTFGRGSSMRLNEIWQNEASTHSGTSTFEMSDGLEKGAPTASSGRSD